MNITVHKIQFRTIFKNFMQVYMPFKITYLVLIYSAFKMMSQAKYVLDNNFLIVLPTKLS